MVRGVQKISLKSTITILCLAILYQFSNTVSVSFLFFSYSFACQDWRRTAVRFYVMLKPLTTR